MATVSLARTRRTAIAAVVADPVTQSLSVSGLSVPSGSAAAIVSWIGDNRDRAAAAADPRLISVRRVDASVMETP